MTSPPPGTPGSRVFNGVVTASAAPTPWSEADLKAVRRLRALGRSVAQRFVGRRLALDLLEVAVIAREHVLLLGPPGTGKTDLVTRFATGLGGRPFVRLLTRFTEPAELFGPLDVEAFRAGRYTVRTEGMLPQSHLAFLDEIFQCGSPILNTLLTVMNERVFHNGGEPQPVPLVSLIGAANALPQDPSLLAFADRFLLRLEVAPVAARHLEELLAKNAPRGQVTAAGSPGAAGVPGVPGGQDHEWLTAAELTRLHQQLPSVQLDLVTPVYAEVVRELLDQGVTLSDRRITRGLRLVAAAALRRELVTAAPRDLWPLRHFWADPAHAPLVRDVVQRVVAADGGEAGEPPRTAHDVLADARLVARQVDGSSDPAAVDNVLRALNTLRRELARLGPADPDKSRARTELGTIIDTTLGLLERS